MGTKKPCIENMSRLKRRREPFTACWDANIMESKCGCMNRRATLGLITLRYQPNMCSEIIMSSWIETNCWLQRLIGWRLIGYYNSSLACSFWTSLSVGGGGRPPAPLTSSPSSAGGGERSSKSIKLSSLKTIYKYGSIHCSYQPQHYYLTREWLYSECKPPLVIAANERYIYFFFYYIFYYSSQALGHPI